jgi:hypothetical protein
VVVGAAVVVVVVGAGAGLSLVVADGLAGASVGMGPIGTRGSSYTGGRGGEAGLGTETGAGVAAGGGRSVGDWFLMLPVVAVQPCSAGLPTLHDTCWLPAAQLAGGIVSEPSDRPELANVAGAR